MAKKHKNRKGKHPSKRRGQNQQASLKQQAMNMNRRQMRIGCFFWALVALGIIGALVAFAR